LWPMAGSNTTYMVVRAMFIHIMLRFDLSVALQSQEFANRA
jgi:hypothetical protein